MSTDIADLVLRAAGSHYPGSPFCMDCKARGHCNSAAMADALANRRDDGLVLVLVARELIDAQAGEWSQPVQGRFEETPGVGTGWTMVFRTVPIDEGPPKLTRADIARLYDVPLSLLTDRPDAAHAEESQPGGTG